MAVVRGKGNFQSIYFRSGTYGIICNFSILLLPPSGVQSGTRSCRCSQKHRSERWKRFIWIDSLLVHRNISSSDQHVRYSLSTRKSINSIQLTVNSKLKVDKINPDHTNHYSETLEPWVMCEQIDHNLYFLLYFHFI